MSCKGCENYFSLFPTGRNIVRLNAPNRHITGDVGAGSCVGSSGEVGDGSCLGEDGGRGFQACKDNKGTIGSGFCIVSLFSKRRLFSRPACFHASLISMRGSVLTALRVLRFGAPMYTSQGEGACTGNTGSIGDGSCIGAR